MSDLAARLEANLDPRTGPLLARFFDPAGPFAAATFDDLPDNPRDRFTTGDLLATTLLAMRYTPRAVRTLLGDQAEHLNGLLATIPAKVDLWAATDADLAPAYHLYRALRSGGPLWGVGPTTASKLMARKRPRLIPVVDRVVRQALQFENDSWPELRDALRGSDLPDRIEALRPADVEVSTLRLLDAAVWMRHSRGAAARTARAEVGLD